MRATIIIPAINEASHIEGAVDSAWRAGASEVIVVDGGSQDGCDQLAEQSNCRLLRSPPGRACQQNAGAAAATGDVLVFQHADSYFAAGALAQLTERATDPAAQCGAFYQRIDADGVRYRLLERGNASRVRRLGVAYGDQGIFVRRELFEQIGGFPEVRLLEDLLLLKELRRHSWPQLLPGPLHISARRWQQNGVIRQTLRNWRILMAYKLGVKPDDLVKHYPRHDNRRDSTDERADSAR
ncbi:MAG: TIGR04283 family arsenosugar biosynthesis glycosyltransferase [Pirellulaceae bacterium]|jgi:rSAM/selenodomain-associated transferase 2|nr:TIGR04283 family arsenosugar biosynthesis glycosyltransferase [Pirellulaceae bacterium]MDP7018013.1 TIGR04283 family arsenosugar biosynthesis glycosyltransferase [Pirellulaceae bacterium]